jgi:hypothetical protein
MFRREALKGVTWRNIPEDGIFHSHRRENLKSYIVIRYGDDSHRKVHTRATRRNIAEDGVFHNHLRENLKSYIVFLYGEGGYSSKGFLKEPHGVTSQKTAFFINTAAKNLKFYTCVCYLLDV